MCQHFCQTGTPTITQLGQLAISNFDAATKARWARWRAGEEIKSLPHLGRGVLQQTSISLIGNSQGLVSVFVLDGKKGYFERVNSSKLQGAN